MFSTKSWTKNENWILEPKIAKIVYVLFRLYIIVIFVAKIKICLFHNIMRDILESFSNTEKCQKTCEKNNLLVLCFVVV